MSMQYEQPQPVAEVFTELESNPSISQSTIAAINSLIVPPGESTVVVGSFDGTTLVTPPGETPQMVVTTIDAPAGTNVFIDIPPAAVQTPVWIFDTDANIRASFGTARASGVRTMANEPAGISRVISSGNGNDDISVLDGGNTTIDGSDGNDILILSEGYDSITGNVGNDSIHAGAGNDTIVSGIGIDTVDGGLGFDVVQLAGNFNDWVATVDGEIVNISGAPGSGNAVEAINIDFISFTGATGNETSITVTYDETSADVMRLYQGLLDRSALQGGAQYWLNQVAEGESAVDIANQFLASPEYIAKYGTQTNTQFVQQVFENALDRQPQQAGLDYWVGQLDAGASRAQVGLEIINSPEGAEKIANVVLVNGLV